MAPKKGDAVPVTEFKARCLALIEEVASGRRKRVVLTKREKPVAAVVPLDDDAAPLWGAMKGTIGVPDGTDLTQPTSERWAADE